MQELPVVQFVDTTLRDGQLSLWASSLENSMIRPVISHFEEAGFSAMEVMDPSHIKKAVRELRCDPWERVRMLAQGIRKTPLRAIGNRYVTFDLDPTCIWTLWIEQLAAHGVREYRFSDPSNSLGPLRERVRKAREVGLEPIVNLVFSVSPKHTDDYYAEKAEEMAKLDVKRICLKDPGGLLTPDRVRTLVPKVLERVGDVQVEMHTHCNTGLGPLCYLEAVSLGIRIINTAIPPLANGSSNPSIDQFLRNAKVLGFQTNLREEAVRPIREHFHFIARRKSLPIGKPLEYDAFVFRHQVPGGMISNLRHQLSQIGMQHRLDEVLVETANVRADLGYPIMVTPYSQFVGTQAAINVILGERYKEVTDQMIQYALGFWGEDERSAIDPNVLDKILDRPRARELKLWEPPDPDRETLRRKYGGSSVRDDELLVRYVTGDEVDWQSLREPKSDDCIDGRYPLATLILELSKRRRFRKISLQKGDFQIRLEK